MAALFGGRPPAATGAKGKAAKRRRRKKRRCLSQEGRAWCGGQCLTGECCPGTACGNAQNCQCMRSIGGAGVCVQSGGLFECEVRCADAAVCARDERCVRLNPPCEEPASLCLPACGAA